MKKKMKKAFTLVELLVVIAILAVLSTVAIVGYNSFTEKANKSVDEQLCTQYNTILQAESVTDNDITLAELIIMIEENGIRANKFETKSKSYLFAYDRANASTVLLDKATGNIEYPKNYDVSRAELWTVLNEDRKLVKGIPNYVLLGTMVLDNGERINVNNSGLTSIKLDLNSSALKVYNNDNFAGLNVTVENGTLIKTTAGVNVTAAANVNVIDASSDGTWGKVFTSPKGTSIRNELNSLAVTENRKWILKDKYIAAENTVTFAFDGKLYDEIIIENCVIENVYINTSHADARYIIKNNQFINVGDKSTAIMTLQRYYGGETVNTVEDFKNVKSKFSYEITGNEFIKCYRGLNLVLPAPGTANSKISNNTFDMINVTSSNDAVKSYCVQFATGFSKLDRFADGVADAVNADSANAFGKLEIKNNNIVSARGLICAHSGLSSFYNDTTYKNNVNLLPVFEAVLTIEGNDVSGAIEGVVYGDPDKADDLKVQEKIDNLDAIVAAIKAKAK